MAKCPLDNLSVILGNQRSPSLKMAFLYAFLIILSTTSRIFAEESTESETESTMIPTTEPTTEKIETFSNRSLTGGNELWDSLLHECGKTYKMSCIQKSVYTYMSSQLETPHDFQVTDSFVFKRNLVDYTKYTQEANSHENDITEDEEDEGRGLNESPFQEITNSLYGKSVKFMMTHDLQLQLPEVMFDGATFKVSPRGFEGNGVLVKLEMIPKELPVDNKEIIEDIQESREIKKKPKEGVGRIFFKKIKKYFSQKLLMSFMALLLVIKLIKVKLMFLLPVLVGVGTAKKIILKVLLFLFPAISHIFKLCSYYHENYQQTKFHHHHHQISHVHHQHPTFSHYPPEPPSEIYEIPASHSPPHHHSGGYSYPPPLTEHYVESPHSHGPPPHVLSGISLHHNPDIRAPPPPKLFQHELDSFELSGPGLGPEYISNRNYDYQPNKNDGNDLKTWTAPASSYKVPITSMVNRKVPYSRPTAPGGKLPSSSGIQVPYGKGIPQGQLTKEQIAELALKAEQEVLLKARLQQEKLRLQQMLKLQEQQRLIEQKKLLQQQNGLKAQDQITAPAVSSSVTVQKSISREYDPFYSPILEKIDAIFIKLGVNTEGCRERLLCSMYKNPSKFSPHSNLISAELSRDTQELQKPQSTNDAVIRFYRYVQAARDGQERNDCLRLYPACVVNTEA